MSSIEFEFPYLFLAIIIFLICNKFCKRKRNRVIIPHLNIYSKSTKTNRVLPILKWLTIILIITSLASPVVTHKIDQNFDKGLNIALILDSSLSMAERGFNKDNINLTKWDSVKSVAKDFITKRVDDNISIVVFGDTLFTAAPLSYDKELLSEILSYLEIGVAGKRTALNDALVSGINSLKEYKSRVIILLTDGYDTASTIPTDVALKLIKKHNIKIYTIGVGNDFDQNSLSEFAKSSGGKFFKAKSEDELKMVYKEIDKLEKSEIKKEKPIYYEYLYIYPLFLAFFTLLTYTYIINRRSI
jgi:Ca-activated chloride channel family protein